MFLRLIKIYYYHIYKYILIINYKLDTKNIRHFKVILDSERSDECIDFTMMCFFFFVFFFVSVDNIWGSKNASIFDFSPSLKRKSDIWYFGGSKVKNFQYILNESGKTLKK